MSHRASSAPRNRRTVAARSSREQLLDVRVRRSTARRRRTHRALRVICGLVLWVGLAVGAWLGFQAIVNKFFLQNPTYNLRVVDAELDDLMSKDEALRLTGIQLGTNIFRLDLARAERALRQIDQIETVSLERDWPDSLAIRITKRVPIAWLARAGDGALSNGRALLLDAEGRTMLPYRIEPEYWRLPVVYVPDPKLVQQGDTLATADLHAALDLLAELRRRPDCRLDIRSIDVSKGFAIEVTDASKTLVTFAPQGFPEQIDRLQKLLEHCRETGRQIESVNLIPQRYTPVRFLLASAQEAVPAKKTSREAKR
jgi:cell division septal protein FtsQ